MTIEMRYPEKNLYNKYDCQTGPQDTHLVLDPEARTLRADWNGEIGNAIPFDVFHGRVRRYSLPSPYLRVHAIRELMDGIAADCERVCDGYSEDWDGQNNVGRLTDDARDADEAIEQILLNTHVDEDDTIEVYDAADWCESMHADLVATIRAGGDPQAVIDAAVEECGYHRPIILERVDEYVEQCEEEIAEMNEKKIDAELERIGVDNAAIGPVDSVCSDVTGADCRLYDDHADWTGTARDALTRLKKLPDGAGYDAFWSAFINDGECCDARR